MKRTTSQQTFESLTGHLYQYLAILVAGIVVSASTIAFGTGTASAGSRCAGLMVYGIQGTGQSSPDADPEQDAGFLSRVLGPAMQEASKFMDRAYVPYDAGFGGAVPGGAKPYADSVNGAVTTTESWIKDKVSDCPTTKFGLVGYSQGAHAVRVVLNNIVNGKTAIDADQLALVANFGDPGRPQGAPLFPGRPGQSSPSPVPGTIGDAVSQVIAAVPSTPQGGGIAPETDVDDTAYQAIAGRYLSSCTDGDLACDAPANAPLTHLVTNIAGQSELNPGDPLGSLSTIAEALAMTTVKTAVPVINEDIQAPENNLESLSYEPSQTLSERLATASDPRTPLPSISDALSAVIKVGTIGLNAVKTVVQTVATPDTIGALAVAGATNPMAVIGILGAKLGEAAVALAPPATQKRWVSDAFDAFEAELGANKDLFEISSLLKYRDAAKQHSSYSEVAATPTGAPPTALVADWITAAANDIAGNTTTSTSTTPTSGPMSSYPVPTSPSGYSIPSSSGPSSSTATSDTTQTSSTTPGTPGGIDVPPFMTGEQE
jgi:hypothetical protein